MAGLRADDLAAHRAALLAAQGRSTDPVTGAVLPRVNEGDVTAAATFGGVMTSIGLGLWVVDHLWRSYDHPDPLPLWIGAAIASALVGVVTRRIAMTRTRTLTGRLRPASLERIVGGPLADHLAPFDCGTFLVRPAARALLVPGVRYRIHATLRLAVVDVDDDAPSSPYR